MRFIPLIYTMLVEKGQTEMIFERALSASDRDKLSISSFQKILEKDLQIQVSEGEEWEDFTTLCEILAPENSKTTISVRELKRQISMEKEYRN